MREEPISNLKVAALRKLENSKINGLGRLSCWNNLVLPYVCHFISIVLDVMNETQYQYWKLIRTM